MRKINAINEEELNNVAGGIGATHAPRRTRPVQRKTHVVVIVRDNTIEDDDEAHEYTCEYDA